MSLNHPMKPIAPGDRTEFWVNVYSYTGTSCSYGYCHSQRNECQAFGGMFDPSGPAASYILHVKLKQRIAQATARP